MVLVDSVESGPPRNTRAPSKASPPPWPPRLQQKVSFHFFHPFCSSYSLVTSLSSLLHQASKSREGFGFAWWREGRDTSLFPGPTPAPPPPISEGKAGLPVKSQMLQTVQCDCVVLHALTVDGPEILYIRLSVNQIFHVLYLHSPEGLSRGRVRL